MLVVELGLLDSGEIQWAPPRRTVYDSPLYVTSSRAYSKLDEVYEGFEAITPAYLFSLVVCPSIITDPNFIDAPPPRARYLRGNFDLHPKTIRSESEFTKYFFREHFVTYFYI